jgi:hypothetical protein
MRAIGLAGLLGQVEFPCLDGQLAIGTLQAIASEKWDQAHGNGSDEEGKVSLFGWQDGQTGRKAQDRKGKKVKRAARTEAKAQKEVEVKADKEETKVAKKSKK